MKKSFKQILAFLLVALLVFSNLPIQPERSSVQAAETSGASSGDLDTALAAVNGKTLTVPVFGRDSNAISVFDEYLAGKDIDNVSLSIADPVTDISGDTRFANVLPDGTLEYFYVDPANASLANTGFANVKVAFTLTVNGQSVKANPVTFQLKWDENKVKDYLNNHLAAFDFAASIQPNTDAQQLHANFKLPYFTDGSICTIQWVSDNSAVTVQAEKSEYVNGAFERYYPVTVKPSGVEEKANLTATFSFNRGTNDIALTKIYPVTVPAVDLSGIKTKMQNDLDQYFNQYVLGYSYPNSAVAFDADNVLYNIQLPVTSTRVAHSIRKDKVIDGQVVSKGITDFLAHYQTANLYSVDRPAADGEPGISVSGYRVVVVRPGAGEAPIVRNLTMTLRHKEYDLEVSKSVPLTVQPVDYDDMMAKVERKATLMQLVKDNFFDIINSNPEKVGLNNENKNISAQEVSHDLSSFAEVRFKNPDNPNDLTLEYIYKRSEMKGDGVVLAALPGWEQQEAWRMLRSTTPRYLTHETLKLGQKPEYDTAVSIAAMLTVPDMENYRNYFPEGSTSADARKLAALFDQPITQELTILGEKGAPPAGYSDTVQASLVIEGSKLLQSKADHATAHEVWFEKTLVVPRDTALVDFVDQTLRQESALLSLQMDVATGWLTSIEMTGYPANTTGQTNGSSSSWMWYIKHSGDADFSMVESLARTDDAAYLKDGDILKLKFINDPRYPSDVQTVTPAQPVTLKESASESDWTGFRGDAENKTPGRAVTQTPVITRGLNWGHQNTNINQWGFPTSISDLLSINGKTFYATDKQLIKLNSAGEPEATLDLAGSIEYFARMAYDKGVLVIPIQGGGVQAVDPETMTVLWVTGSLDSMEKWSEKDDGSGMWEQNFYNLQSLGTTYIDPVENMAYVPLTAIGSGGSTEGGILRAIDLATGEERWSYKNYSAGYYWSGVTAVGDYLLIGNDQGIIEVLDTAGNKVTTSLPFSSSIRSTLVQAEDKIVFTTNDGVFHSVKFDAATATFSEYRSLQFAAASTSTPTVHQGKAYVGGIGGDGNWGSPGVFAVIDLATLSIEYKNEEVQGEVKSSPLVLFAKDGNVFAYFTGNAPEGLLYVYHDQSVDVAYKPTAEQAQYTTATPIADANGNVYYSTDAAVISLLNVEEELGDYTLEYAVDPKIGSIKTEFKETPQLSSHARFMLTDVTENIRLLYDDEIQKQIGDVKYVSFRSSFSGALENQPAMLIELALNQDYLPLASNERYVLYKLEGNTLVQVSTEQVAASQLRPIGIAAAIYANALPLAQAIFPGSAVDASTIRFTQKLNHTVTYVLATVSVPLGIETEPNRNPEEGSTKTIQPTAEQPVSEQTATREKQPVNAVARTGEEQDYTLLATIIILAFALSTVYKKRKIQE